MTNTFSFLSGTAMMVALVGGVAPAAQAADTNTYIGAHMGLNAVGDSTAKVDFGSGIVLNGTVDLDNGPEFGVVIGQRFGGWRLEAEAQRGSFKVVSVELAGTQVAAGVNGNYVTMMLNGYRTLNLSDSTALFAGAGIGWGRMTFPNIAFDPSCNCFAKASKGGFAYQFRGGVQQKLTDNVEFFGQYNRLFLPSTGAAGTPGVSYPKRNFGVASLGLLIHLGGASKAAAAAPAPAMAPAADSGATGGQSMGNDGASAEATTAPSAPAAPALPQAYIVYFDVNQSNVSADGAQTLDQAAAAFQQLQNVRIALVGGTDTTGSERYNLQLSQKRVNAVKAYLLAKGISGDVLAAQAVGEKQLRVETSDNKAEPANRRVEINIQGNSE